MVAPTTIASHLLPPYATPGSAARIFSSPMSTPSTPRCRGGFFSSRKAVAPVFVVPSDPLSSAHRCEPPQLSESPQPRIVLPPLVGRRSASASRISDRCLHFHQLFLRLGGSVAR
ncbi:uncharacterized protein M6B38_335270 [Iris pallida]|uniref:Uncharacterized protein n=1 Tax=Iris pallida TaxID=29817 RepID=A0AAX6H044_IRIPA|nr:uncharacterized protein M6B38_335270 [Iris pallida]